MFSHLSLCKVKWMNFSRFQWVHVATHNTALEITPVIRVVDTKIETGTETTNRFLMELISHIHCDPEPWLRPQVDSLLLMGSPGKNKCGESLAWRHFSPRHQIFHQRRGKSRFQATWPTNQTRSRGPPHSPFISHQHHVHGTVSAGSAFYVPTNTNATLMKSLKVTKATLYTYQHLFR